MQHPVRRLAALAALALSGAAPLAGQDAAVLRPGETAEEVVSRSDPAQRYAVFLPSAYDPSRRWPLLVLMDPRGRALLPLERHRAAAERYGYVVLSSYNTLSDVDSAGEANEHALRAMLQDAQAALAVEPTRVYLAGLSGTARAAWHFAPQLGGAVAGVLGTGAGTPLPPALWQGRLRGVRPFAFFGSAGEWDYNHHEMTALGRWLEGTELPHRIVFFEGGHDWYPPEVAEHALTWFHLQAMKTGGVPRDEAWIDSLFAARTAAARTLEATGRGADALAEWRSVVADFGALRDVAEAEGRIAALTEDRAVRRTLERRAALDRELRAYLEELRAFAAEYERAERPVPAGRAARTLRVERLRARAAGSADREDALAARRMLENVFVSFSFYEARRYLEAGDWGRALELLRLSRLVDPEARWLCYETARTLAQLGRTEEAFADLRCAVDAGVALAVVGRDDPLLDPLRGDPRFAALQRRGRRAEE